MPLTITVPDDIARAAAALAESARTTPEDLLLAALKAHFLPLAPELQEEFDAWERASDEDMARLDERERCQQLACQSGLGPSTMISNGPWSSR